MYDEFYDEPSEFDIQIEEWKDTLRECVKKEYKEEMERLRKENAELLDIKKNWQEKIRELETEKFKLKVATIDAENKAKKARLRELLDAFTKQAWGYKYTFKYIHEKCDKCDKDGYIHYKSPQGRNVKEKCDCRKQICFYSPQEAEIVEIDDYRGEIKPTFAYNDNYDDYKKTTRVYAGENFDDIDNYYGMVFFNKDDCERFCEYKNSQNIKE
ncbi:MAG: hypothetical protein IKN54_04430 [Lachnospiraceae bacterium]|nr:hypothetical protein [Lachnospiraceae bacterium]